jgi:hypothetical protein
LVVAVQKKIFEFQFRSWSPREVAEKKSERHF